MYVHSHAHGREHNHHLRFCLQTAQVVSAHLDLSKMGQKWGILNLREGEAELKGHQWRRLQLLAV